MSASQYDELTSEQHLQILKDLLRHHERGHLETSTQLELAQACEAPDPNHVAVLERQSRDNEAQCALLREKIAAHPGA